MNDVKRIGHRATGLALCVLGACTINPVTGDRELALVSAQDELAIGAAQYAPSRQMQGGDYVLDPDLTRYVQSVGQRLAAVSDRNLPYEFSVLNNSIPNAWALPGGKIAINRGLLLELDSEAELAAVLGHEIVHAAARHGALAMQRGLLLQGALLVTAAATNRNDYSSVVVGAASVGAQLINQRNSRSAELESDEYGMLYMQRAGYDPRAAIDLQETFVRLSQSRGDSSWLEGLFASHPPSAERVERNRQTAARLPAGGELGTERYAAAIAGLQASAAAYENFDTAREALANDRLAEARNLARMALNALPEEAEFHALLADVDYREQRYSQAARGYQAARERNEAYFYYPLRLGFAMHELGELSAAQTQLEASLALLPTADAHYGLGRISEARGDRQNALAHYRAAAESSGAAGRAARDAVVRIDLPQNPTAYLQLASGLDSSGQLIFELSNPTNLEVADVVVTIRYATAAGGIETVSRSLYDRLPAGGSRRYATGIGPFTSQQSWEITLDRASIVEAQ
ncbi:MAG: M48 family metalloprotease [Gammaproteobacteria bacterium]|jgi:predicted Zn-dependent protease